MKVVELKDAYEVGDRVRYRNPKFEHQKDIVGTIIEVTTQSEIPDIVIRLDTPLYGKYEEWIAYPGELEHISDWKS